MSELVPLLTDSAAERDALARLRAALSEDLTTECASTLIACAALRINTLQAALGATAVDQFTVAALIASLVEGIGECVPDDLVAWARDYFDSTKLGSAGMDEQEEAALEATLFGFIRCLIARDTVASIAGVPTEASPADAWHEMRKAIAAVVREHHPATTGILQLHILDGRLPPSATPPVDDCGVPELLRWLPADGEKPPAMETRLLWSTAAEYPYENGYWDGKTWISDATGGDCRGVVAYAEVKGPKGAAC